MRLSPADLAQTHAAAFTDSRPWSAQEFTTLLQSPGVILCGDARSFILGRVIADEAEVLTIATAPAFQRKGLGRSALQLFLRETQDSGAASVFLEVADTNEPAKSLYFKEGFQQAGRRASYYLGADGTRSDAILLRLTQIG